jgi:hypothetical protein
MMGYPPDWLELPFLEDLELNTQESHLFQQQNTETNP